MHQGNVGDPDDCLRVVDEVIDQHGRLDVLVNNAGVTVDRPISAMSVDDWHNVLRVNLSGAFYMSKPALAHMLERGSGRIINISSVVAETGNVGQANYAASKSGLLGFTKSLAREAALAVGKAGMLDGRHRPHRQRRHAWAHRDRHDRRHTGEGDGEDPRAVSRWAASAAGPLRRRPTVSPLAEGEVRRLGGADEPGPRSVRAT